MYKSLAALSGMLVAIMVLANGILTEYIGNTQSVLFVNSLGLFVMASFVILTRVKWQTIKGLNFFYLLGGVTGIVTVYATNVSFLELGATVTLMISMIGRILTSSLIDHFGLMGMERYPFKPLKLVGIGIMVAGLLLIVFY